MKHFVLSTLLVSLRLMVLFVSALCWLPASLPAFGNGTNHSAGMNDSSDWRVPYGQEFWRRSVIPSTISDQPASLNGNSSGLNLSDVIDRVSHAWISGAVQSVPRVDANTYAARFEDGALLFSPYLPTQTVAKRPWQDKVSSAVFRTRSVQLGSDFLYQDGFGPRASHVEGNVLQSCLNAEAGLVEHYESGAEGVQVSWVLHRRPQTEQSLTIEADMEGLNHVRSGDGWHHFSRFPDAVGVRISDATAVDASGRAWPIPLRVSGQHITLDVGSDVLAQAQFPLAVDPTISAEFSLSDPVYSGAPDDQYEPAIAWDGTRFLVVWEDERDGSYDIFGTRVSSDGTVLDRNGIAITDGSDGEYDPTIAWNGTHFLVVWHDDRNGSNSDIYGSRMGSDGTVLDLSGIAISTAAGSQANPQVACNGSRFLIVWEDDRGGIGNDIYAARVEDDGTVLDSDGIAVTSAASNQNEPILAWNGTCFLLAWEDHRSGNCDIYGARVTGAGTVLDSAGIPITCAAQDQENPAVSSDGTDFFVVWEDERSDIDNEIYGARVSGAGVVLDPAGIPISTIPTPSSFTILSDPGDRKTNPAVAWNGSRYFVVWEDFRNRVNVDIYGARVGGDGTVVDPSGLPIATFSSPHSSAMSPFAISPQSTSDNEKTHPTLAWNGSHFLVVWQDMRDEMDPDIHGVRVGGDGTVLDPAEIDVSTTINEQEKPAVAWNGSIYLAVWSEKRGDFVDIYGTRISSDGIVLDPAGIAVSTAELDQSSPAVCWNESNFWVVWEDNRIGFSNTNIYGARVSSSGTVLDTTGIAISSAADDQSTPAIASDGEECLVVWQDARNGMGYDIYGARVNSDGTVLGSAGIAISTASTSQSAPAVAFDGSQFLVVWQDTRNGTGYRDVYGSRVSSDGTVLDSAGIAISSAVDDQEYPNIASIGTNCLVVWEDNRNSSSDIYGARVNNAGSVLDSAGIAIATTTTSTSPTSFDASADGLSSSIPSVRAKTKPANGSSANEQRNPAVVRDGILYLVVWENSKGDGGFDIYGARVTGSGAVVDTGGIPLATGSSSSSPSSFSPFVSYQANDKLKPVIAGEDHQFLLAYEFMESYSSNSYRPSARGRLLEFFIDVNAGSDSPLVFGNSCTLNGTAAGGVGSYTYLWSVLSGPNSAASQFSSATAEDPVFTPGAAGTYVLQLRAADGAYPDATDTIQIAVTIVNDAPTLDQITDPSAIIEDSPSQTISLSGIGDGDTELSQTLIVSATSSNTALIPNPTVDYTSPNTYGELDFLPLPDAFGTAVITVTVTDDGENSGPSVNKFSRAFTVTVNPVNDPPRLTPSNGIQILSAPTPSAWEFLGESVAVDGDTAVVGNCYDPGYRGAVYVFIRDGNEWSYAGKLSPPDPLATTHFSHSVSISGDTVAVGAFKDGDTGAAYVFEKPVGGWTDMTPTAKLTASDGGPDDRFGAAVSISGDTVVVGAPRDDFGNREDVGSAYVFTKPGSGWSDMTQTAKLIAVDGAPDDSFGAAVSISGDTVVVGAPCDDIGGKSYQGSAYVFAKPGSGWIDMTQTAKLTAADGAIDDSLGDSVAISGDTVVAGAPCDGIGGKSNQGSAYVFAKPGSGWTNMTQTGKLTAADGTASEWMGVFVSISGNTIAVSVPGRNEWQGCVSLFSKPVSGWTDMASTTILAAEDGMEDDIFGYSLSVSGSVIMVGMAQDDIGATEYAGSVRVFESGVNYIENAPAAPIDSQMAVCDIDGANLIGATVQIVDNYQTGQDLLSFPDQLGISGSWNPASGTLTLTGTASVADYQTALRSVAYLNTNDYPDFTPRTVLVTATDEASASSSYPWTITITNSNDAPLFVSSPVQTAVEDSPYTYAVVTGDMDPEPSTLTLSVIQKPDWAAFTVTGNGTGTLSGTPANGDVGSSTVTLRVSDGSLTTDQIFAITVTDADDPPYFHTLPIRDAYQDREYRYSITVLDPDTGGFNGSITALSLPAWLTCTDLGGGKALLAGTPGSAQVGLNPIYLRARNGSYWCDQSFDLVVHPADPTPTPTGTAAPTELPTPVSMDTATPTEQPTPTLIMTPTATATSTETATPFETVLPTGTALPTETALPSETSTPTSESSPTAEAATPTPTSTASPTPTPSTEPDATPIVAPTPTVTLLPTSTPTATHTPALPSDPFLHVTDNLTSFVDLCDGEDPDEPEDRGLVLRWNAAKWNLNLDTVSAIHFYVKVDNGLIVPGVNCIGDFFYLGRTPNSRDSFFEWKAGNRSVSAPFANGPEYTRHYEFQAWVIFKEGPILRSGPYSGHGSVFMPLPPDVTPTPAPTALPLTPVMICDHISTMVDLTNAEDRDPKSARSLVVRWVVTPEWVVAANIQLFHIYVSEDNGQSYRYLGQTPRTGAFFEWKPNGGRTAASFRSGPQFERSYRFRVYALTGTQPHRFRDTRGSVQYLQETGSVSPSPSPTITPTPTVTPTPLPAD